MIKYIGILISLLVFAGCQAGIVDDIPDEIQNIVEDETNQSENNEQNLPTTQQLARQEMMGMPTYQSDGRNLMLLDSGVRNNRESFSFAYESTNTGYGDKQNKETMPLTTGHVTEIQMMDNRVVSAVTDNYWNELDEEVINLNWVTLRYEPVQCEETPWQIWYDYEQLTDDNQESLTDIERLERYYALNPNMNLMNVQKIERSGLTCQACGCLKSYYYTADVEKGFAVNQMLDDLWEVTEPLNRQEVVIAARNWISNTPTYSNGGTRLGQGIIILEQEKPQVYDLSFEFYSDKVGYGDSNVLASSPEYRRINLLVEDGVVTEAIINGEWDELNQKMLT